MEADSNLEAVSAHPVGNARLDKMVEMTPDQNIN